MTATTIILVVLSIFLFIAFLSTFKVVPQRSVYIVERLGKYSRSLEAGFHILIPFIDKIAYKQNLKEQASQLVPLKSTFPFLPGVILV